MYASEKSQWCGEPYFVGAAISISAILPQIPRRGKHKSFLSYSTLHHFGTDHTENTDLLSLFSIAVESCLLSKPLHSDGYFMAASLVVVA
jgi:hypothetical protein